MKKLIMFAILLGLAGCSKPAEPETGVDPADAQKRRAERDKVIEQGNPK